MKRSKRYAEIAKSYDKHELVDVATAVKQIKSFDNAKFDETVEWIKKMCYILIM